MENARTKPAGIARSKAVSHGRRMTQKLTVQCGISALDQFDHGACETGSATVDAGIGEVDEHRKCSTACPSSGFQESSGIIPGSRLTTAGWQIESGGLWQKFHLNGFSGQEKSTPRRRSVARHRLIAVAAGERTLPACTLMFSAFGKRHLQKFSAFGTGRGLARGRNGTRGFQGISSLAHGYCSTHR